MVNGLIGTHLATGQTVEIELDLVELALAKSTQDQDWNQLNDSIKFKNGFGIIGEVQLDFIIENGTRRVFH
jgi:DNA anti-recombination protein RmuC